MRIRGVIFLLVLIIVLSIFVNSEDDEFGLTGGGEADEEEQQIIPTATPYTDPENIPNAVYSAATDDEEASLDVTEVEEAVAVNNYQGQLTGDGWGASARYSNAIFDKNGIYQHQKGV